MSTARSAFEGALRHFTTDRAVRAGVTTAAWSVAASYARGLLPRTAVQQAAATGVIMTAHYEIGATLWAGIASTAAGLPGQRPGPRALLTAAAISTGAGKGLEIALRPRSGDSLALGCAWSTAKMVSVVGLAGGLVTASDLVAHDVLDLPRTPGSTLALDLGMGGLMALGTIARRRYRSATGDGHGPQHEAVKMPKPDGKQDLVGRAKPVVYIGGAIVASTVGLGLLAVAEQAGARRVSHLLGSVTPKGLGEFGDLVGHLTMFSGFAVGAYFALRAVRVKVERRAEVIEPAYNDAPNSPFVSCGSNSRVPFDAIGKEGRRFVIMRLSAAEISSVVGEPAAEPVRVVIPNDGSDDARVELALAELRATGGIDRSLICVAAPTGVGYVNYVMAEALEYLARGDCAIVVPQYAYVPSALALDLTDEGTALQRAVIAGIQAELRRRDPRHRTRVVQFGESLGAQVAADVGGERGVEGFDDVELAAGLYLGVPFRSLLWRAYQRDPAWLTRDGRLVNVPDSMALTEGRGRHVMVNHPDDPINKFAYTMVVQRPSWLGPPETRPPLVPRETVFRPVTSFVLALVDLLNGMNMKPGQFRRVGHDYRIDLREALQKTYSLPADPDQEIRIEAALRIREQEWAEKRLIAKTGEKALRAVRDTLNSWGQQSVNLELSEGGGEVASSRLVEYLNARLGRTGAEEEPSAV